jgi:hypothetical protein
MFWTDPYEMPISFYVYSIVTDWYNVMIAEILPTLSSFLEGKGPATAPVIV